MLRFILQSMRQAPFSGLVCGGWVRKKASPEGSESTKVAPASSPKRKKRATTLAPQHEDPAWQVLDEKLGGRVGLQLVAASSSNPKAAILAELLLDPAWRNAGTKALAKKAGLSMPEIVDLYRDKQWLETTLILHEKLPQIIDGATDDAKPRMVPCEECKGTSKDEKGADCWVCGGWGEIRRAGDKDKLAFVGEAVGMTGKRSPVVQVNTQINNQGPNQPQSFDELMRKATVRVEKPALPPAIDVEVEDK
jgi:hypothetical protein